MRIASTAIGTSPWPVIMMTGSVESTLMQLLEELHAVHARHLDVADDDARDIGRQHPSAPLRRVAKVSVSKPDSASHWLIDWRMSFSSSTIATFIALLIGRILIPLLRG